MDVSAVPNDDGRYPQIEGRVQGRLNLRSIYLATRVILPPDGGLLDVTVIGPGARRGAIDRCLEQVAEALKITTPATTTEVPAGTAAALEGWTLSFGGPVWLTQPRMGETAAFQAAGGSVASFWRGRARTLRLEDFQKPQEVLQSALVGLIDLDQPVAIAEIGTDADYHVFRGQSTPAGSDERTETELGYLVVGPDRTGLLMIVNIPAGGQAPDRNHFDTIAASARCTGPAPWPPILDLRAAAEGNLLWMHAPAVEGWMRVEDNPSLDGFHTLAVREAAGQKVVRGVEFEYLKGEQVEYHEAVSWWVSRDLKEGGLESQLLASLPGRGGARAVRVERQVTFDENSVTILVKAGGQSRRETYRRPGGFVLDGLVDLWTAVAAAGRAESAAPSVHRYVSAGYLTPHLREGVVRVAQEEKGGPVRVVLETQTQMSPVVCRFTPEGVLVKVEASGNLTLVRTSESLVRQRFPHEYRSARSWILENLGEAPNE